MCNIKVTIKDGRASVFTPFNRDFVAAIRNVGGRRWDAATETARQFRYKTTDLVEYLSASGARSVY